MRKKVKVLKYSNNYNFLDYYWKDFQSPSFIPKVDEALYSINTKHCRIQFKGMITSKLTDDSRVKLSAILGFLTGSPVNVKVDPLDLKKVVKKNKSSKKSNQEDINLNYLLESNTSGDYCLDLMIIICTALLYQPIYVKYKIIPHSTGKVKLILWTSLDHCTKLLDLNKSFFREFSFSNIPLKVEIIFSNKAENLNPSTAKAFIFTHFPFYLISSKLVEDYGNN